MLVEKAGEALVQRADDARSDGVIEHRRRADLHRPAAEEEIVQRVLERGDAADTGKTLVGKRLREL